MTYRNLSPLTDKEKEAAIAYSQESGLFQLISQGSHFMALDSIAALPGLISSPKLADLLTAAKERYELTESLTVYSGHGNGRTILGGFGVSDPARLIGLKWRNESFISTSESLEVAEGFMDKRAGAITTPTVLVLNLKRGVRALPMQELGSLGGHEMEYILPPGQAFEVVDASRVSGGIVEPYLLLTLDAENCDLLPNISIAE